MEESYLVVGLGNPGKAYEKTRHNIGWNVLKFFAEKHGFVFKSALSEVKGNLALGRQGGKKVFLLHPMTYMNQSGSAVKLCTDYFKIPLSHLMVISDEADLPFGKLRLRKKGSAGSHNGLKSIEYFLQSQEYPRLRVGIGQPDKGELADYVLGNFTEEENNELPKIIEKAVGVIDSWLAKGIELTMNEMNKM